ncbi:MAG: hypothetical protein KBT28_10750 [Bacteroidales bacterium]|nr:hypothetical protein [Candidatus Colimorpha merdihippi]
MKYNATFRYRLASQSATDDNGMPVASSLSDWYDGTHIYAEKGRDSMRTGSDGAMYDCDYKLFLPNSYVGVLHAGDEIELSFASHMVTKPIASVDDTGRKYVVVWL